MPALITIGSATGSAILSRLLGSGIHRLGSLIFQKVTRTIKIESAFKTGSAKNQNIQKAISDFETVIGSRYGKLTEKLGRFLEELERTGLINLLVENAIFQRQSADLENIFMELHEKIVGKNEGDAGELYKQLNISFSITMKELSKDKIIFDIIQLHNREMSHRLEQIDEAISNITKKVGLSKSKLSYDELSELLLKIAKALQGAYRYVRVETNRGARSVDITRIYIPSNLRYRNTKKNVERLGSIKHMFKGRGSDFTPSFEGERDEVGLVTYTDLRLQFNRAVILGDPGGGKSTLCQHLCFDLAKQSVAAMQVSGPDGVSAQLQKFPIRIILRHYERAKLSESQLTIYEYIIRDWANFINVDADELRVALDYVLSTGRAALAFDGLDEILATARRREYVDLVVAFCNQYPLCPVVVTSRLVGYDDASLPEEFDELILEKFTDEDVQNYAQKFLRVVGERAKKDAEVLADSFYEQTTQNASDLRRNPLMCGLMLWIFNNRRDVPSNRPEIYRECAILMFERWDLDRDIKTDVPTDFDRLQLFSELASKIYGNPKLSGGVEFDWLEKQIKSYFERVYEDRARAYQSARSIVKFITGRAWVMSEMGEGIFAFTHQTFLEYFFAHHLDEIYDSIDTLYRQIVPRLTKREWDMVSHLALQIKSYRNLRRQNEVIDFLLMTLVEADDEDRKSAIASFAARALEYLAASEINIRKLLTAIFAQAISSGGESMGNIVQCCDATLERREFVRKTISDLIVNSFSLPPKKEILNLLSSDRRFSIGADFRRLPGEIVASTRRALEARIVKSVEDDAACMIKAWEWYGNFSRSAILKFGLGPYYAASFDGIDGLSVIVICTDDVYLRQFDPGGFTKKGVLEALSIIGALGFTRPYKVKEFGKGLIDTAPGQVWFKLSKALQSTPSSLVGALVCMLIVSDMNERYHPIEKAREEWRAVRGKIGQWALRLDELKKLQIYPKLKMAIEAGKFLVE